jgi:hypothetical protein
MTALSLYKFITKNDIAFNLAENQGKEDVLIFIPICLAGAFANLIKPFLEGDNLACSLGDDCLAVWMAELCDFFEFEINEVFEPGKKYGS